MLISTHYKHAINYLFSSFTLTCSLLSTGKSFFRLPSSNFRLLTPNSHLPRHPIPHNNINYYGYSNNSRYGI